MKYSFSCMTFTVINKLYGIQRFCQFKNQMLRSKSLGIESFKTGYSEHACVESRIQD